MNRRNVAKINYAALAACDFQKRLSTKKTVSNSAVGSSKKCVNDILSIDPKLSTDCKAKDFVEMGVNAKIQELKDLDMFIDSSKTCAEKFHTNMKSKTAEQLFTDFKIASSKTFPMKFSLDVKPKTPELKPDLVVMSSKTSPVKCSLDVKPRIPELKPDLVVLSSKTSPVKFSLDVKLKTPELKPDLVVVSSKTSPVKCSLDVKPKNCAMDKDLESLQTAATKSCRLPKNVDTLESKYASNSAHCAPETNHITTSKYSILKKTSPNRPIVSKKHPILVKFTNPLWKKILVENLRAPQKPFALEECEKAGSIAPSNNQPSYFISVQAVAKSTADDSKNEKKSSWVCERCNRVLRSKPSAIQKHQLSCYSSLSCDRCNRDGFVSLNLLERHVLLEHCGGLVRYPCVFCQRTFSQSHFLRGHVYNEHRIVWLLNVPFRLDVHCRSCAQEFESSRALAQHLNLKCCYSKVNLLRLPLDYAECQVSLASDALKQSEQSAQLFPGQTRFADVARSVLQSQPEGGSVRVQLRVMIEQKHSDIKRPVPIVFQAWSPAKQMSGPVAVPSMIVNKAAADELTTEDTPQVSDVHLQLQCIVCDQMFETIAQLKSHSEEHLMQLSDHHPPSSIKPKCPKKSDILLATDTFTPLNVESGSGDQLVVAPAVSSNHDESFNLKSADVGGAASLAASSHLHQDADRPICAAVPVKKAKLIRSSLQRQIEHEKLKTQTKKLNRIKAKVSALRCYDCDQMFETAAALKSHTQVHLMELVNYQQALISSTLSRGSGGGDHHEQPVVEFVAAHKRPSAEDMSPGDAKRIRLNSMSDSILRAKTESTRHDDQDIHEAADLASNSTNVGLVGLTSHIDVDSSPLIRTFNLPCGNTDHSRDVDEECVKNNVFVTTVAPVPITHDPN